MDPLLSLIKAWLSSERLRVADVGSTGGAELRWRPWSDLCSFYTFDPDPRAATWGNHFRAGLWSSRCQKSLHLAKYPPASSLFEPNFPRLHPFHQADGFQAVGEENIPLETLDHLLGTQPIDFLKIDAEGAELHILEGGRQTILSHVLGLQLEAYFYPIRKGAPTFFDLHALLSEWGFELFQLEREHWVRRNGIHTSHSSPQLIWGNTLYLLPKTTLLAKKEASLVARYVLILLAYGMHDYAYELCEEAPYPEAKQLRDLLTHLPKEGWKTASRLALSLGVGALKYLCATSADRKRHYLCHLRRKGRALGKLCLYLSGGKTSVTDG